MMSCQVFELQFSTGSFNYSIQLVNENLKRQFMLFFNGVSMSIIYRRRSQYIGQLPNDGYSWCSRALSSASSSSKPAGVNSESQSMPANEIDADDPGTMSGE